MLSWLLDGVDPTERRHEGRHANDLTAEIISDEQVKHAVADTPKKRTNYTYHRRFGLIEDRVTKSI